MIEIVQASTDAQLDQVRDLMRAMIAWQRQRYHDVVELVDKYHDKSGFEVGPSFPLPEELRKGLLFFEVAL